MMTPIETALHIDDWMAERRKEDKLTQVEWEVCTSAKHYLREAEKIVHCGECKNAVNMTTQYKKDGTPYYMCDCSLIPVYADGRERDADKDFCSKGEREC